ncbi:iron-siderophore ABC transporter substrate-binding protein [filamentous cyanobacterium LEGE 07170]|nr:iron-siderophore ABC transporter substrate-binding protein [filamentous cyanobacterium LEGE 07170]
MGNTQVPLSPERVVVLDYAPLDTALALGIQPVGTIELLDFPIYPDDINTIATVGAGTQPNLEAILQLQPDLILGSRAIFSRWYGRLSQIAPTVLTEDNGRDGEWQENVRLYAEALGKAEQAEQLLADYQQRVAAFQTSLSEPLQQMEVSVITTWTGGVLAYSADSFSGAVLRDIGFARNPAQGEGRRYGIRLSREDLTQIDGDVLFLLHSATLEASVAKADFVDDPLWSQLNAVEQGLVCEVNTAVWAGGRSILAANQILQDVETCLGG